VISVGYGVSIFNMTNKEFGDSSFFISGGTYEASNEATIFGNKVYSVTNSGLKSHELNTTFPVYTTWTKEVSGSFKHIDSKSELVFSSATNAYIYNNGVPIQLPTAFGNIRDLVISSNNIVVTDTRIYTYGMNGVALNAVSPGEECNTAIITGGKILSGTVLSGIKDKVTIPINLQAHSSISLITSIYSTIINCWCPPVPESTTITTVNNPKTRILLL
jgi:hypothetical protein